MLNEKEMSYRVNEAKLQGVPITNYGTAIAHMNGILKRSLEILPKLQKIVEWTQSPSTFIKKIDGLKFIPS